MGPAAASRDAAVFGRDAYSVSRRTRRDWRPRRSRRGSSDVLQNDLCQGLRTFFIGVAIGIAGSLALTHVPVASLLFGGLPPTRLTFGS